MKKFLGLSFLLLPVTGIATGICFSTTSCGDSIPSCPDNIVINGPLTPNSTVFKTLMNPYNSDWDISAPFSKNDFRNDSKYPTNLIKWDIAWQYSYYFGNGGYSANLHFDLFERQGSQVKYQISMTPLTGGIAIISKTSIYDTEPDVPEFVDIDVSNTNQGSNTQKQYEIHSWSSGSVILGDYYKYALSMFTTKLDFSN